MLGVACKAETECELPRLARLPALAISEICGGGSTSRHLPFSDRIRMRLGVVADIGRRRGADDSSSKHVGAAAAAVATGDRWPIGGRRGETLHSSHCPLPERRAPRLCCCVMDAKCPMRRPDPVLLIGPASRSVLGVSRGVRWGRRDAAGDMPESRRGELWPERPKRGGPPAGRPLTVRVCVRSSPGHMAWRSRCWNWLWLGSRLGGVPAGGERGVGR